MINNLILEPQNNLFPQPYKYLNQYYKLIGVVRNDVALVETHTIIQFLTPSLELPTLPMLEQTSPRIEPEPNKVNDH